MSAPASQEDEAFKDAFAPGGLRRLPPEHTRHGGPGDERAGAGGADDGTPADAKEPRNVSLKSTLLADNSVEMEPSETALLRDLPYTLQGLSSTTLPFAKETSPGCRQHRRRR